MHLNIGAVDAFWKSVGKSWGSYGFIALLVQDGKYEQEANPEEHGQMTLYEYSANRRKSMMKLRDWLRTGTLGKSWHTNLLTQKMAHDDDALYIPT